jgi:uncharacterized phiE125 gp8 family phage protein
MRITETIPTVLTWADIKAHCRLDDDYEKDYLVNRGKAAVELFEKESRIATGQRTVTIVYSEDDLANACRLEIPKGPVISITSITDADGDVFATDAYELRKSGHYWYAHLEHTGTAPITAVYEVGHATVSELVKTALLIYVEEMHKYRGSTSTQQTYALQNGLDRLHEAFKVGKVQVG